MAFERPTLQTIIDRILSDFQSRITGATTILRRSILYIMGRVYGGAIHGLYGFLEYIKDQLFITTADSSYLDTHGSELGVSRKSATYAAGSATVTGTTGTTIPAGTEFTSDAGETYASDSAVVLAAGTGTIDFTAKVAGADGNDVAGAILSFVSPILGVNTTITVDSSGITGGTDVEADDDYRSRLLNRKRQPPHGGAEFDYTAWALEVSGVTRAWAFPEYQGVGTIGLAFVRDDDGNILPDATERATVRSYIVEHSDPTTGQTVGIPVTAEPGFFILPLSFVTIDLTIAIYPNTAEIQSSVTDNIETLIVQEGGPEVTIYLSQISSVIAATVGEERHRIDYPLSDITTIATQIHALGTITFTDY